MILDTYVELTIGSNNARYWRNKGYTTPEVGGRGGCNGVGRITVKVVDLPKNSNVRVKCCCDRCGVEYNQRFCRNTNICSTCRNHRYQKGNKMGALCRGTKRPSQTGEKHHRWNPNKKEFSAFANRSRWLSEKTYRENIHILNPNNLPRRLCGIEGGYQLDHIVSLKEAYDRGWSPEEAASLTNLQLLPWKDNREKW